jgi:hypothetical protein
VRGLRGSNSTFAAGHTLGGEAMGHPAKPQGRQRELKATALKGQGG